MAAWDEEVGRRLVEANDAPTTKAIPKRASSKMGMYSTYFKPTSGKFNQSSHGRPRCVSILPGVVCVGTDEGVVLVYVFNSDLDGSVQIGTDGYGKLSLVAEIPDPYPFTVFLTAIFISLGCSYYLTEIDFDKLLASIVNLLVAGLG